MKLSQNIYQWYNVYMTRYHFFNMSFPDQADQIHKGYSDMSSIVWNAFTKVTRLDRFFAFTPTELKEDIKKEEIDD